MKEDLIVFKQYFQEAAEKIPSESFFYGTLKHKYRHSIAVWQAGKEIMDQTPELVEVDDKFRALAERALLFHDVGRFEEAVRRYEDWQKNILTRASVDKYDHGIIGYEILKKQPKYNDLRILLAIKYHGKMMEEVRQSDLWQETEKVPEGAAARQILYLVRDADKTANLRVIKQEDHLRQDLFFKQLTEEALKAPISAAVMQQFKQHQTVLFKNVYSFADRVLMVISWIFDLNYQRTKELFVEEAFGVYLLDLLSEYGVLPATVEEIRQVMTRFLGQNCRDKA